MKEELRKLWMPVTKDPETGEYFAALSDTSLDRDEEAMDKGLIIDWAKYGSLKALANHDNSMQSWVGGWKELKSIEKGNNAALFAKPWFFSKDANPLAAQIKKQVDEALERGEKPGISVGAIVHDYEMRKINGKEVRVFTKGELLEATWVPIQSNRNASYGHIAKQFGMAKSFKTNAGENMTELTQKDIDMAVEKKESEYTEKIADFKKQLETKDSEIAKLKKDVEDSKTAKEESEEKVKEAEEKTEEAEKKIQEAEKKVETAEKSSLEKQKIADEAAEKTHLDAEKAFDEGKLPIMRT